MNLAEFVYVYYEEDGDSEDEDSEDVADPKPIARDPFRLSDTLFKKSYRLSKPLARALIGEVTPFMKPARRSSDLTITSKVMMSLNFLATGSYQNSVGNHINTAVTQATVSNSLAEVVTALNNPTIFGRWIKFPSTYQEMETKSQRFFDMYGMPGVVGCIDCTHVAIFPPPNNEHYDERTYVNRKGYHSINTQLICDAQLNIMNVNALFPGGTHDSFIWNQSAVLPVMRSIHALGNGRYYLIVKEWPVFPLLTPEDLLLSKFSESCENTRKKSIHLKKSGDSGYGLRPWLHTPIYEPQTRSEENYNSVFKTARCTIERCNGVLKTRFRCLLKHRVLHYAPRKAIEIINSCCVLHNMCLNAGLELDEDEDDDEQNIDYGIYPSAPVGHARIGNRDRDLVAGEIYRNSIVSNYF